MGIKRKPEWLKIKLQCGQNYRYVEDLLATHALHTVCKEANCPNRMECYSQKTATFMILGKNCTRNCSFCNVSKGNLLPPDPREPENLARAVDELGLAYVVITSVTRDDLPDGGASHFSAVIKAIRTRTPQVKVEVLIPDFQGNPEALQTVATAFPAVINHNIETVSALYPRVRPLADYHRSLRLLGRVKEADPTIRTKSGMMLGLGETEAQVIQTLHDLRRVECDYLTMGQYLAPSALHYEVKEYLRPEQFSRYQQIAQELGFKAVAASPLVRSSYNAARMAGATGQQHGHVKP